MTPEELEARLFAELVDIARYLRCINRTSARYGLARCQEFSAKPLRLIFLEGEWISPAEVRDGTRYGIWFDTMLAVDALLASVPTPTKPGDGPPALR